jgi:zinc/manganese transport system substrate-binding protein
MVWPLLQSLHGIRRLRQVLRAAPAAAILIAAQALAPAQALAQDKARPRVFTCEPEWAALVLELMPQAQVFWATTAFQDPHHIEARPALIAHLRQADLAVCTGAGIEEGWLPTLQQRAANPKVQDGALGMFYAAQTVSLIDPRAATLNPFAGDIHPGGNPHLHADPHRVATVARALVQRLQQLWPGHAAELAQRHAEFDQRWAARMAHWRDRARPLQGQSVAAQHSTFAYWWRWLGIQQTMDLEPKPGLPPTPTHLQALLRGWSVQPPLAVVVAAHQDPRAGRWLVDHAQPRRPLVLIPATVVDPSRPQALEHWFDEMISALLKAAPAQPTASALPAKG